jgi:hypothetical protein
MISSWPRLGPETAESQPILGSLFCCAWAEPSRRDVRTRASSVGNFGFRIAVREAALRLRDLGKHPDCFTFIVSGGSDLADRYIGVVGSATIAAVSQSKIENLKTKIVSADEVLNFLEQQLVVDRFRQVVVAASFAGFDFVADHGMGGDGDDWDVL